MFRATGFGAAPHQSGGHARRGICLCGGQGPTYRQMRCWLSPKERESRPQPLACSPGADAKRCFPRIRRETRLERPEDGYTLAGRACEATRRQRIAHAGAAVNAEEIRKLFYRNRLAHLERRCETHGRGENSLALTRPHTAYRKGLRGCGVETEHAILSSAATQTTQVVGERFLRHLRIRHLPERYS